MPKTKTDDAFIQTNFFSLEIQFSNVEFNENYERNPNENDGVLSVQAKFMKYPTIEITEDDFCDGCEGEEMFNKGKHFLIALEEKDIERLQKEFIINLKIMMTSHTVDLLPVIEQIGFTSANIARTFRTLLSKIEPKPSKHCPKLKLLSDQLEIVDLTDGTIIGTIHIHLRLKAFGNCMITDMKDFSDMFDKCVETKIIVDDTEDGELAGSSVQEKLTLENDEFQELNLKSKDVSLRIKVTKPVYDFTKVLKKEKIRPGTILCIGNEQIVFLAPKPKDNEIEDTNSKFTYDMKTGMVEPADDQIINVIPESFMTNQEKRLEPLPSAKDSLSSPETVEEVEEDIYGFYIKKVDLKNNLYSMVEWDVKIPKNVPKERNRHTRDVQYHPLDLVQK